MHPLHHPRLAKFIVVAPSGCWIWCGATIRGYGELHFERRTVYAHRLVYEMVRGPIPVGLTIDHLCRVTLCVNPGHLEPVTARENSLRGTSWVAVNARKTRCKRGHDLADAYRRRGQRECRTCANDREERKRRAFGVVIRGPRGPYRRVSSPPSSA